MSLAGSPRIGSPTARSAVANSSTLWCGGTYCASKWISAIVADDEAVENLGEPQPRLAIDATHDAEVYRSEPAVLQREQISLVQIGVEETVDDCLAKEGAHQVRGKGLEIVAGCDQCVTVSELDPLNPFEGHHPA
jgi:hypothetical protein